MSVSEPELLSRIAAAKAKLGEDLVILGHHYQQDSIIRFVDFRGDSLELSRAAAAQKRARYIVFCGVDFMAETAAMLCDPSQTVLLPALGGEAKCPMAAMVTAEQAQDAWQTLAALWGEDGLIPITYQNSTAEVKAFCGRHSGAVCTSANAQVIMRSALEQGKRVLFFPDEWLGRNSALALGILPEQIALWDPQRPEANGPASGAARVVVWKGYCHVHTHFTVEHVRAVREKYGDVTVVVHPECRVDVVQAADLNGSTSFILRSVRDGPPGTTFAVGTEIHMVNRLAQECPDKTVVPLARSLCGAMYRVNPYNLLYTLERLLEGEPVGVVTVSPEITHWANAALERMMRQ